MDGFVALGTAENAVRIHPTAIIDPATTIGVGVRIGPYCVVGPDVVLGDRVQLMSHVVIEGHTTLGDEVVVHPFATVGLPPQDFKYKNEPTRCEIGARTLIREHCSIHRGTATGRGFTKVGSGCMLMAVVHVAHDCVLGDNVVIANNVVMGGHVEIGDNAVIGGSTAIHQFVRIGRGAMVGGMVGVPGDVVPFSMVTASREGWIGGLNVIGLKRRGYTRDQIHRLRRAFRSLFTRKGVLSERRVVTEQTMGDDPLIAEILSFMDSRGKRGLTPAHLAGDIVED